MIDPRSYDFAQWAQRTTQTISVYGSIPSQMDEEKWKSWAKAVIALPGISAINAPNPDAFSDWRAWAFRFNQALQTVGSL